MTSFTQNVLSAVLLSVLNINLWLFFCPYLHSCPSAGNGWRHGCWCWWWDRCGRCQGSCWGHSQGQCSEGPSTAHLGRTLRKHNDVLNGVYWNKIGSWGTQTSQRHHSFNNTQNLVFPSYIFWDWRNCWRVFEYSFSFCFFHLALILAAASQRIID